MYIKGKYCRPKKSCPTKILKSKGYPGSLISKGYPGSPIKHAAGEEDMDKFFPFLHFIVALIGHSITSLFLFSPFLLIFFVCLLVKGSLRYKDRGKERYASLKIAARFTYSDDKRG